MKSPQDLLSPAQEVNQGHLKSDSPWVSRTLEQMPHHLCCKPESPDLE